MGKTVKWIKNFLTGKNEKTISHPPVATQQNHPPSPAAAKEKRRWRLWRPSGSTANPDSTYITSSLVEYTTSTVGIKIHKDVSATKIQSVFRSYLAQKALSALKGIVKLQALVRGHLVRKQAAETLQRMHTLTMAQARARARAHRTRTKCHGSHHGFDNQEEHIKIVEMDICHTQPQPLESGGFDHFAYLKTNHCFRPNLITHYTETLKEFGSGPSYMANTQSSRAKVRSHSVPKQRAVDHTWAHERQSTSSIKRRPSIEGRNLPRVMRMNRSSSHVGPGAQTSHFPWSIKLDRSTVSLVESECESTSTALTHGYYSKSVVEYGY